MKFIMGPLCDIAQLDEKVSGHLTIGRNNFSNNAPKRSNMNAT